MDAADRIFQKSAFVKRSRFWAVNIVWNNGKGRRVERPFEGA